ncbi:MULTISPECIES: 16S rRNA (guanine(527)-N(7))-methyltransferase RsmG [unclassified Butyrivibrio]|uniref:16S rRNA (guanine(527)-N(7))-methyltransferase RsmG n=1 Tax=unclassified Butyrivibrio TaxID=2639466 RepID=UPI0003B75D6A|nr:MULTISPECIES: 16S rRNA (guanine(527)-N(7))-methyltransferase RsmG [unclassified Butyrivibrio]SEL64303.1 16S rRNA (guanine527-N7)-methyltransferase [Butyrivibrio sp. ob235]
MNHNFDSMIKDFNSLNIKLSDKQIKQFEDYYELLIDWNNKINLTAITEFDDVCKLHFVDSIASSKYFDFSKEALSLIDVGTGAGFPGIVLKIVFPKLNVTLLDSLQKRITFLDTVIDSLNLNESGSIKTVHGRAEDYSDSKNGELREKFDIAVSRAVAGLSTLCEYDLPYVKVGGSFIAYKGDKGVEEVADAKNAIFLLGGKTKLVEEFCLPDTDIKRTICIIDKVQKTSSKYPRKAGTPQKKPL